MGRLVRGRGLHTLRAQAAPVDPFEEALAGAQHDRRDGEMELVDQGRVDAAPSRETAKLSTRTLVNDGPAGGSGQLAVQPGAGQGPVAAHGALGESQGTGRLPLVVAGEEAALDHPRQPRRALGQPLQGLV